MYEQSINADEIQNIFDLFGSFDNNIKLIQKNFNVKIINRGSDIKIYGELEDISSVKKIIDAMIYCLKNQEILDDQKILYIISQVKNKKSDTPAVVHAPCVDTGVKRGWSDIDLLAAQIRTREEVDTFDYITAEEAWIKYSNDTYDNPEEARAAFGDDNPLAKSASFSITLKDVSKQAEFRSVDRIVLTRPAVEVGESLGFLPGDLQSKIDPYLRPLYDALFDIVGINGFSKNMQQKNIEIAPLAYMRGRTLNNSFIILDEAQNTTPEQMKMFLTRLGFGSRVVITGDITQIDLPKNKKSGLVEASKILKGIDGIEFVRFDKRDVVRHKLVKDIIEAYNNYDYL